MNWIGGSRARARNSSSRHANTFNRKLASDEEDIVDLEKWTRITPEPEQRRTVPLLEFIDKTWPSFGHTLSLQLRSQLDITRVRPEVNLSSRVNSTVTSGSGPGSLVSLGPSRTITTSTPLNIPRMPQTTESAPLIPPPLQLGPSTTATSISTPNSRSPEDPNNPAGQSEVSQS